MDLDPPGFLSWEGLRIWIRTDSYYRAASWGSRSSHIPIMGGLLGIQVLTYSYYGRPLGDPDPHIFLLWDASWIRIRPDSYYGIQIECRSRRSKIGRVKENQQQPVSKKVSLFWLQKFFFSKLLGIFISWIQIQMMATSSTLLFFYPVRIVYGTSSFLNVFSETS